MLSMKSVRDSLGHYMTDLSIEFTKKIAALYLESKKRLDDLDPTALTLFASRALDLIKAEKLKTKTSHDLDVLEAAMRHLEEDAGRLKSSSFGTDEYDFAHNDCRQLMKSTIKWLNEEGLA